MVDCLRDIAVRIFVGKLNTEVLTPKENALIWSPRWTAGTPLIRSSFYVHLGLQIGLNFVPEPIIEPLRRVEIPNRARD